MKKFIVLALGSFIISSCNGPTKTTTDQETITQEKHEHDEHGEGIELNNGEKWVVNDEMKPYVNKGEGLVTTYLTANQTDYVALAKKLKNENDALIKSCTMKGKDHDELHKWLEPHLALVAQLETEKDAAKATETVTHLQKSYVAYHQYFN